MAARTGACSPTAARRLPRCSSDAGASPVHATTPDAGVKALSRRRPPSRRRRALIISTCRTILLPAHPVAARLAAIVLALCALCDARRRRRASLRRREPAARRRRGSGPNPEIDVGKPIIPPGLEDVGVTEHLDGQIPLDTDLPGSDRQVMVRFRGPLRRQAPGRTHARLSHVSDGLLARPEPDGRVAQDGPVERREGIHGDHAQLRPARDPGADRREARRAPRSSTGAPKRRAGIGPSCSGDDANIHRITDAVGFKYHYVEREQQFAHPTVILILKPNGQLARYLYGLEYSPKDLRLGLLEASNGRSISTVDRVILYCYHYDPNGGRYVLVATRVMQVGAGFCGLMLLVFLGSFWIKELVKARATRAATRAAAH